MTICEGLPRAIPEDVGISTSRLERITPSCKAMLTTEKSLVP